MEFCIRNFICEHTQELPGAFEQVPFGRKNRVPVFHIYGVTDTGQKACLHVHGVLPYLVLRVGGQLTPAVYHAMRAKINRGIQREIELSTGNASKYQTDYVYKMEGFTSRPIYGYQEEEEEFVRVYFSSPWYLQKATTSLGKEVLQKSVFQPFEAHLPFHLQFFIDNSIFGMDNIYLKKVKFRISPTDVDDDVLYKNKTIGEVKTDMELLSPYDRCTSCVIECDANVSDILNLQMHSNNVHSSNPGLEYIWREEKERCDAQGIELVDVFNSYEPRKAGIHSQEREMLRSARQIARNLRSVRNMSASMDDLMQTRIAETQRSTSSASSHNMTIWEEEKDEEKKEEEVVNVEEKEIKEEVEEDDDEEENDDENELEMTMMVNRKDVVETEEKEEEEEVIELGSDEEEEDQRNDRTLHWITTKSAYNQKYISMNRKIVIEEEQVKKETTRLPSREMTSCSVLTEDTVIAANEYSQTMEQSKFLSQTSIDETIVPSEKSGESDIVGLCVASLELLIDTKRVMPDVMFDQIVGASLAIYDDICRQSTPKIHSFYTIINIPCSDPRVVKLSSETEIIEKIYELVVKLDVDVLTGYDVTRLSWSYLLRRAKLIGLTITMDRMRMTEERAKQIVENEDETMIVTAPKGRLLVAVWKVVRSDLKLRSYDLGTAIGQVLRRKIAILDNCALMKRIETGSQVICEGVFEHLLKLPRINVCLLIEMNWFLNNSEMARVYGIQFNEVWTRGSQLRVESMLLRLAHRMNFVAPSVTAMQRNIMTSPEQLQLILEPQSKVYFDPVIVLDFQSLYPSMVIAYNYCYSTILGKIGNLNQMYDEAVNLEEIVLGAMKYQINKENLVKLIAYKEVCASPLASLFVKKPTREGVVPLLLREILSARIMVKNSMKRAKSKKLKRILDARQLALKLVANVTYGYTAANWSGRMPCAELADAILGKGRETLERAIDMVKKGEYGGSQVIYGDTDSMFVLVPGATIEKAFEIGRKIAEDVTNDNPDPVVLKLEKVYKGCVLETKKRYAGWMYEHENDTPSFDAKGIETVRRDTCPIVAEVLEKSLELIFNQRWRAFATYLNRTVISLSQQNISKFMFCKEYRGDYSNKAMVPQKKIAEKRLKVCPSHTTLRGERIAYVIVDGSPGSTVYSCVRSIDEYTQNKSLKINVQYYLNSHILAALRRVTDLLPTRIDLLPLVADQCYSLDCTRLGQSPWCIQCQKNEAELAAAFVQIGRETRGKRDMREICRKCQNSCHQISEQQFIECANYSCLIKQTNIMMDRNMSDNVIRAHKLY